MSTNKDSSLIDLVSVGKNFDEVFDIFSHCLDGRYLYIIDLKTNYARWSEEAADYFDLPGTIVYDTVNLWKEKIEPKYRKVFEEDINRLLNREIEEHNLTYRVKNKFGEYITCSCRGKIIYDENDEALFFTGSVTNNQNSAMVDYVTGLFNRTNLFLRMGELHSRKKPYCIMMIGIRQFYKVNFLYGYSFGNKVLKTVANTLRELSGNGSVFRTDGVKMVLLFEADNYDTDYVAKIYDEIHSRLKKGIDIDGHKVVLEVYASLLCSNNYDIDASTVYNTVMFTASKVKRTQTDKIKVMNGEEFSSSHISLGKLNRIRNSILEDFSGFYLVYQPIISAVDESIIGAEVLLRWQNDEFGYVQPGEFIEWLERDALFYELGNWILRQAFREIKGVIEYLPEFMLNVNIAYTQLQNLAFKSMLCTIIEEENFNPRNLILEITERCQFIDIEKLKSDVAFFKSKYIKVALDDFGTGNSTLDLILELPIDQIKIDRIFIDNIGEDLIRQSFLRAITTCAEDLGKSICVEGVETNEMVDFINKHFNVNKFQGYYYSKPLPIDEFKEWTMEYQKTKKRV